MLKRFGLGLLFACAVSGAEAQTTIRLGGSGSGGVSDTSTAAQDLITPARKTKHNLDLCKAKGVTAANCTQANLNAVAGCASGECGKIYASTAVGDGEYFLDRLLGKVCVATCVSNGGANAAKLPALLFDLMQLELTDIQGRDIREAFFLATSAAPNSLCTEAGISTPCTRQEAMCGAAGKDRNCR